MTNQEQNIVIRNIDEVRLHRAPEVDSRMRNHEHVEAELVVAGGGIAGVCAAVSAARQGSSVVLVQDRPVLGGNASSEVRLWMLGATSHMGNNNRWSRESGVMGEILVENLFRNREGNPLILDTILLELVVREKNIRLLLNTCIDSVVKDSATHIEAITAFCSQNSTQYTIKGTVFMDCSGDGIVSFMAGAAFRMGAETAEEFGEKMAPAGEFGYLLGHSLYFYSKDTGKPVSFIKPSFADLDIDSIYRYRSFALKDQGCNFWWVEFGGRSDTVHDTEQIKWELWKVVYGIWDYIKNSGKFPEAATHTLEWVGTIPGKRESRRFEGLKMITQQDIVEQRQHVDAVAFGGWALDLHPADGVFSDKKPCLQYHSRGVYQIPLGCSIGQTITNLAFGGRIISSSHVAFGSTRVMATCGYVAQATSIAAVYAIRNHLPLQELVKAPHIAKVQTRLQRAGQHIPGVPARDDENLTAKAAIQASSSLELRHFVGDGPGRPLDVSCAMLLPVMDATLPAAELEVTANRKTSLKVQLRVSELPGNFTPEVVLEEVTIPLREGRQNISLEFTASVPAGGYAFICFLRNAEVTLANSNQRLSGVLAVFNGINKAVSNNGRQAPEGDFGVDSFEFWCPKRRPEGRNLALSFASPVYNFGVDELRTGFNRPTARPNAWVAAYEDLAPEIQLHWQEAQTIRKVVIHLDTDFDHAMESVLMGHPESVVPFCVQQLKLFDDTAKCIGEVVDNHQEQVVFEFIEPVTTRSLKVQLSHPSESVPASVFSVNCYS